MEIIRLEISSVASVVGAILVVEIIMEIIDVDTYWAFRLTLNALSPGGLSLLNDPSVRPQT